MTIKKIRDDFTKTKFQRRSKRIRLKLKKKQEINIKLNDETDEKNARERFAYMIRLLRKNDAH